MQHRRPHLRDDRRPTWSINLLAVIVLIHTGALRVQMGALSQGQVVALYNYMSQILVRAD